KATRALSSTLDLDQILSNILVQLQHVVHYNTASLFLLEGNHLIMKTNAGFADDEKAALKGAKLDTQINIPFKRMAVYPHHPIMIPDAHKEKIFDELIGTKRIRSWIGVPLLYHGEIIGQLSVDNWKPNQYDEDDVNLVTAFAQQATSAIANAHLFSDQKEWANRLLVLNKTLGDVSSVHSIEERLDRIAYGTVGLLGCDMGGVVLYDEQKKEIYMPLDYGYHGIIKGQPIVFRQNIDLPSVQDLFSPNVISSSDSVSNPSLVSILHGIRDAINATNIMISPLSASGRYIGFLYAARNTTHVFSDNEKSLLTIFARHAGIATRNIELRHQDERRAELLELFHQIGVAVQRTSDLERILNIILTGVTAEYGLRFNRAMLLLMDSTRKYLVGCTGIGQTNKLEAEAIWETLEHGEHSFNHYAQEVLEYGVPNWTPIHYLAKNLRIPIKTDSGEIFSRVVMTQQSEIVDPITGTYLIDADFYQSFEPSAFVLVPILVEGKVLGVLVADNKFTGIPIIRKDFDLLATCASQAAMAIERSSLYEQLQHRIAVLHHLQKVAQNISELSDLREALQGIVKAANQVLEADVSYLVPYDKETGELLVELAVSEGDNGSFEHARKFSDRGLTTLVINEQSGLVVISDLTAHPELVSRPPL
ncbi:MAG: GAF domain-containing protein, partial [Chloroflexi bacterium]|nr:GAF domain-containing protein [Chloroflexota bacterium]